MAIKTIYYAETVARAVREHGWQNSSAEHPTWQEALSLALDMQGTSMADMQLARTALDYCRCLGQDLSEFEQKLKAVSRLAELEPDTTDMRIFAAYLVYYQRRMEAQELAKRSDWVGQNGQRLEIEVKVLSAKLIQRPMSAFWVVKVADAEGNIFTVFDNAKPEGSAYIIRGTVKGHGGFMGVKETLLNRVTWKEITHCKACGQELRSGNCKCVFIEEASRIIPSVYDIEIQEIGQ